MLDVKSLTSENQLNMEVNVNVGFSHDRLHLVCGENVGKATHLHLHLLSIYISSLQNVSRTRPGLATVFSHTWKRAPK